MEDNGIVKSIFALGVAAACVCGGRAEQLDWSSYADGAVVDVPAGETQTVTDDDLAKVNKLKLRFTNVTARVEFNTADPLTCVLSGTGTVVKTSSADWTLSTRQNAFYGNFIVQAGVVRMKMNAAKTGADVGAEVFGNNSYAATIGGNGYLEICDGAQLECGSGYYSGAQFAGREVRARGVGPDGRGGIINETLRATYTFVYLTLTGDLLLGSYVSRDTLIGVAVKSSAYPPVLNMNGHRLDYTNVTSGAELYLRDGRVINPGPMHFWNYGQLEINNFDLGETDEPVFFHGDKSFYFYGGTAKKNCLAQRRPMVREGGSVDFPLYLTGETGLNEWVGTPLGAGATNHCVWRGAAHVSNATDRIYCYSKSALGHNRMHSFAGPLVGAGRVWQSGVGKLAFLQRENPEFTGRLGFGNCGSTALGGSVFAYHPGFVNDYAQVDVYNGYLAVPLAGDDPADDAWSRAQILALANAAAMSNGAVIAVNTGLCADKTATFALDDADIVSPTFGLGHDGEGRMTLTGVFGVDDAAKRPALGNFDGELVLTGGRKWPRDVRVYSTYGWTSPTLTVENVRLTTTNFLQVGGWTSGTNRLGHVPLAVMRVRNAVVDNVEQVIAAGASVTCLPEYSKAARTYDTETAHYGEGLVVGVNGAGVLSIEEGAVITNNIRVGLGNATLGALGGAVYQRAGAVTWRGSPRDQTYHFRYGYLGYDGPGYWEMTGGYTEYSGYVNLGSESTGQGLLYVDGGAFRIGKDMHSNKSIFAVGNSGRGHVYVKRGDFARAAVSSSAIYVSLGGGIGMITVDGEDAAFDLESQGLTMGSSGNSRCYFNVCRGLMRFSNSGRRSGNAAYYGIRAYVNFNGGTFAPGSAAGVFTGGLGVNHMTIYAGGATIRSASGYANVITNELEGACGGGVVSAAMPAVMAKKEVVGVPWVDVVDAGGSGYGATAMGTWDKETRRMTGVKILAPGCNYSADTWAVVRWGAYVCSNKCVVAEQTTDGGLAKEGPGSLELRCGKNSFRGPITLREGTLKAGANGAIPCACTVVLAGGALDMNGKTMADGGAAPAKWSVDCAAALAAGGAIAYPGNLAFPEGATLEVTNAQGLADRSTGVPLLTVTGTLAGTENLTITGLEQHLLFKPVWRGKTLRLASQTGLKVFVR